MLFEVATQLTINIKPSNHGNNNRPNMRMKLSPSISFTPQISLADSANSGKPAGDAVYNIPSPQRLPV
jgi:hypothetical protein